MRVEDLIVYGKKYTSSTHAKMLLAAIIECNPLELLTILDKEIEEDKVKIYKESIKALVNNKPIQYVIGNVNFYGLKFNINENVLIPRFETEELVDNVKNYLNTKNIINPKIIDLGCGSGAIGLTLKKLFPQADVTLVDISKEALKVAKENANNLKLDVTFIESDWFNNVKEEKYDVIISNPPYIKEDEEIEQIVKENEPHLALYGGKDGLDAYKKILKDIKNYLNDNYLIAFEIGYKQREDIKKLIEETIPNCIVTIKKDLSEKDRMIFVENKND